MSAFVLVMVLLAAALHAGWNMLVKMQGDKLITIGLIDLGSGVVCFALLPFVPFPIAEAWPFIVVSALIHVGYKLFLIRAYHHADMGVAYPIARGLAPALVALTAFLFAGETLTAGQMAAISAITLAITGLTFADGWRNIPVMGVAFAVGTGMIISIYTVIDGLGARAAGNAHSYTLWMFALDAVIFTVVVVARRGAGRFIEAAKVQWKPGLAGGAMSTGAYWIVIWAMTVTPMAAVSAVRETSVLFGALLAGLVLKEGRLAVRLLAAVVITCGVVGLQW